MRLQIRYALTWKCVEALCLVLGLYDVKVWFTATGAPPKHAVFQASTSRDEA